jgi:7-cyano-7-deazaguanine synthase in queuosine biosynthesis
VSFRAGPRAADLRLDVERNLLTGLPAFSEYFGELTTLEADLLVLAAAVFAADRACVRGEREHYARQLELSIPVVNTSRLLPVTSMIEETLRTLSNDSWRIRFRQISGSPTERVKLGGSPGRTLLFSGGLDSLAAAVSLQREGGELRLVSHITRGRRVREAQDSLLNLLRSKGPFEHYRFVVSSRDGPPLVGQHAVERSQRTRSFMFLILAALVGVRTGGLEILVIAENGPMAIHLPLTSARVGAFSTHTAHPDVLALMEGILREVLEVPITIRNPFIFKTKSEVVRIVLESLPAAIPVSVSCWKVERLPAGASHCGECVPCLIRRSAIEALVADQTGYQRDLLGENVSSLPSHDTGRRNIVDLAEFALRIRESSDEEIINAWPELYSANVDAPQVIAMYRRFVDDIRSVFSRYPGVAPLLA